MAFSGAELESMLADLESDRAERKESLKGDGNIVPPPTLSIAKRRRSGADMEIIVVEPADSPPVRFKGRTNPERETQTQMFFLKAADGAIGGHAAAAQDCYRDFRALADKIAGRCGVALP